MFLYLTQPRTVQKRADFRCLHFSRFHFWISINNLKMSSISTLSLVPTQAVVYAASNASNSTSSSTSSSKGGAEQLQMGWKAGTFMGMLMLSPIVLGLGL
jgi:hypothetical protein